MDADKTSPVVAVLLAAGRSRRFGPRNKLLAEIDGEPLVRRAARALLESRVQSVIVVTGFERDRIEAALDGLDVRMVHNPDYDGGLGASLARGIGAIAEEAAGALVCLADMPGTRTDLIDRLVGLFEGEAGNRIVFPAAPGGRQGNPVLWPRRYFERLAALRGDAGGKAILEASMDDSLVVETGPEESLDDIDTPKDLASWVE